MDQPTRERFLDQVKNHKLEIIKDDGIYRHLRLSSGNVNMYYEIITYPGGLLFRGDMGSYVFERIEDMFDFFDSGIRENGLIGINEGYWEEKVTSESRYGNGVKQFSIPLFKEKMKKEYDHYFSRHDDSDEVKSEMKEVWEEIEDQVLSREDDEHELITAVNEFSLPSYIKSKFSFEDPWEWYGNCYVYTYHYIWCLYAIVYGIKMYKKIKASNDAYCIE